MRIDFGRNVPDLGVFPSQNEIEILIQLLDDKMDMSATQTNPTYMDSLRKMRTSFRSILER